VSQATAAPVDLARALVLVDGDRSLLVALADVLVGELPTHLETLRAAFRHDDAQQAERAAHSLKGALLSLGATPAADLAHELQMLGHMAALETGSDVLLHLEQELERLTHFLATPGWADQPAP
jgi:HPt (histidine-containing phosphotransfer) domain-containing protein